MNTPTGTSQQATPEQVRSALTAAIESQGFARSDRLKAFLAYIVDEHLAGRSDTILGKTIAQDVYDRDPSRTENAENLVRVDAGRLRRKLEAYYAGEGAGDPVQIVIDPGGYAPRFVVLETPEATAPEVTAKSRLALAIPLALAGIFALALGGVLLWVSQDSAPVSASQSAEPPDAREVQRQALAVKSAASVRAANLCDQGRGFLFPIAEVGSQRTAIEIFERAMVTDPELACGYAGLAHALATLARLSGPGDVGEAFQRQAAEMAGRAVSLEPTNGWSQSAAAWSAYAQNDIAEADRLSKLAVELSPRDGNVLDFRGTIAGVIGDFEQALVATDPALQREFGSFKFARRNIRAVALFHLGDYAASIASLEEAIRNGDPVSAMTLTYLTVGHFQSGNRTRAEAYARELSQTWPDARPDVGLSRLYATPELAQAVLEPLSAAGWRPSGDAL